MVPTSAIAIRHLHKQFGTVRAVDGVSLTVEAGEVFGFLGPNGAGKTTTIRCLMDFIRPTSGDIQILGQDSHRDTDTLKAKIGYLAPDVRLYSHWTGNQHIRFVASLRGCNPDAKKLCQRLQFNPTLKVKTLSSGNRQKLGLILALLGSPPLLVLDEPTVALDPILQNEVYALLSEHREGGGTTFISSHNLSEVERICTRAAIIRKGKLVATESISDLKQKKLHLVHARFAHACTPSHFQLSNVEITEQRPDGFTARVSQDLNPLLKAIARCEVVDLDIAHASLEDTFLSFYR